MTGSNGGIPINEKVGSATRALDWLYTQGVSTVLLFALCYGLYQMVPSAIKTHFDDMKEQRALHKEERKTIEAEQKAQIEQICTTHEKACEAICSEIEDLSASNRELAKAIREREM